MRDLWEHETVTGWHTLSCWKNFSVNRRSGYSLLKVRLATEATWRARLSCFWWHGPSYGVSETRSFSCRLPSYKTTLASSTKQPLISDTRSRDACFSILSSFTSTARIVGSLPYTSKIAELRNRGILGRITTLLAPVFLVISRALLFSTPAKKEERRGDR